MFSARSTFNDRSEEELKEKGLPNYNPTAPTVAEMTKFALEFLSRKGQFFLVAQIILEIKIILTESSKH